MEQILREVLTKAGTLHLTRSTPARVTRRVRRAARG